MVRIKEAPRIEHKLVRVEAISGSGVYLIRPESSERTTIPDFGEILLANLRTTYPNAQWLGGHTVAEMAQAGDECERGLPSRVSAMVSPGEGKAFSVRSTEYPESSPHDLHSRFVIFGRAHAVGERFRLSVSDNQSITHGLAPWLATLEYDTRDPLGLIHAAVEVVNGIVVPGEFVLKREV